MATEIRRAVERLATCVATFHHPSNEPDLTYATFDRALAAKILAEEFDGCSNVEIARLRRLLSVDHASDCAALTQDVPCSCGWNSDEQWISVGERLPEMYRAVLIEVKPQEYPLARTFIGWQKRGIWFTASGEVPEDFVTHWMPVPERATGKEDKP